MLDINFLPTSDSTQIFVGNTTVAGTGWQTWVKPKGKTMAHILLIGAGGSGGGSSTTATVGGGGGGGSGSQLSMIIPLSLVGDALYLNLSIGGSVSYVTLSPTIIPMNTLAYTNMGGNGGNGTGAAAGIAGVGGAISTVASMPIGWGYVDSTLVGQAGTAGALTTATATSIVLPTTGLVITGGAGGGGNGVTGAGGGITGAGSFPSISGSGPNIVGTSGFQPITKLLFFYGGTGAGPTATTPLFGGTGAYGCGGGGGSGGNAIASNGGQGGPALCIITSW